MKPDARRPGARGDRGADNASGLHTRVEDLGPILGVVAAIDTSAGEVDHDVRAVELFGPVTDGDAVPRDDAPRCRAVRTAQDDHLVTGVLKGASEDRSHLTGSARDDDLHV